MKSIKIGELCNLQGGACTNGQSFLGGAMCAGTLVWPLGTIIFGPSCAALVVYCSQ
jgi:hypothetical protein